MFPLSKRFPKAVRLQRAGVALFLIGASFTMSAYGAPKLGGDNSGGANSAADSMGQRRLLDLVENEELDYFVFDMSLYGGPAKVMSDAFIGIVDALYSKAISPALYSKFVTNAVTSPATMNEEWEQILGNDLFKEITLAAAGFRSIHADGYAESEGLPDIRALNWAFVDFDLNDVGDAGVIRITNPETKKQLAIQKDGLVVVNRGEFNLLDASSKAALLLHESVLFTVKLLNPKLLEEWGTAPVRLYVKRLVSYLLNGSPYRDERYPAYAVKEAWDGLGIPMHYGKDPKNSGGVK